MTLADKIRQMSDADLAKFIKQITDCCNASGANGDDYGCKICPNVSTITQTPDRAQVHKLRTLYLDVV